MQNINYFTAFLFGLLAFLSPCTFPLVPSFLAFLVGVSVQNLEDSVYTKTHRNKIMLHVFLYILGASLVLVVLGSAAGSVGYTLRVNRYLLQQIGGVIVIVFGLSLIVSSRILLFARTYQMNKIIEKVKVFRSSHPSSQPFISFLLGVVFTLGWIPCLSPILGGILVLASSSSSTLYGATLLFIYALGQNLPLLFIAFLLSSYLGYLKKIRQHISFISNFAGIILILTGIILLFGGFSNLTKIFYSLGNSLNI